MGCGWAPGAAESGGVRGMISTGITASGGPDAGVGIRRRGVCSASSVRTATCAASEPATIHPFRRFRVPGINTPASHKAAPQEAARARRIHGRAPGCTGGRAGGLGRAPRRSSEIDGEELPDYVARSFEARGFFLAPMSRFPPERRHGVPASFCVSWGGLDDDHNDPNRGAPAKRHTPPRKRD